MVRDTYLMLLVSY